MSPTSDAYGAFLLAHHASSTPSSELIERDDGFIDSGSEPGLYFSAYESWSDAEQVAVDMAHGRVLDIGCGAGRHALYLQHRGLRVLAIDDSAGAIKVCKLRGVTHARVLSIAQLDRLKRRTFDSVLMLGNNFGLLGSPRRAKKILRELHAMTSERATILVGTRDPYRTTDPIHLAYHGRNIAKGRMAGQLRIRARFRNLVGPWFQYLFVSQAEMRSVVGDTGWRVERVLDPRGAVYHAVIGKI